MPSSAFDTFFACTIIVAAALIAIAFLGSTLQATITGSQDINKDSYLQAIADRIVAGSGSPTDWGTGSAVPDDFGLAAYPSVGTYVLDMDKVSRLNSQNSNSLSYLDLATSAKLTNIAVGFSLRQVMALSLEEVSQNQVGSDTSFTFSASTTIDSKPVSASLHGYIVADGYLSAFNASTDSGSGQFTVQFQSGLAGDALLVVFARVPFDERITSYATYNFAAADQEQTPADTTLALSPQNHILSYQAGNATVKNATVLSYSYRQSISSPGSIQCSIPHIVDKSPLVLVVSGQRGSVYFAEWTAYPQVPLESGSSFRGTEKNVFSYLVTVGDVLYQLDLTLGDVTHEVP
ncbi:MAG: hypothetical protein NWE93_12435 [Candidatus Bathyarchaeota archaeon]|nr:hypothetical protein [Candidatus Bathyarchaeota archaeon]